MTTTPAEKSPETPPKLHGVDIGQFAYLPADRALFARLLRDLL